MTDWDFFVEQVTQATAGGNYPIISKVYEKELRPLLVGEQLLTPNRELVGKQGNTLHIRVREGRTYPAAYSETSAAFPASIPQIPDTNPGITWTFELVVPTKFGHKLEITSDLIETAQWDIFADYNEVLVAGMAEFRDMRIWNSILNATDIGTALVPEDWTAATGPSGAPGLDGEILLGAFDVLDPFGYYDATAAGLLEIVVTQTASPAVPFTVDYKQAYVKFTGDPLDVGIYYTYTTRRVRAVKVNTELGYVDVAAANTTIQLANSQADTIVVDPYAHEQLINDDKFLARDLLKTQILLNGTVGQVAGDAVLMTQMMYAYVGVVMLKQKIGYHCWKRIMTAKKEDIPQTDGDIWMATYEKSIPIITRPTLITVLLNAQADAYTKV